MVITPGSVGGSQGMYQWLAQDLAERGYLVLLFDVQGQGTSETLPHTNDQPFRFCTSTRRAPYANPGSAGTTVDAFNPWWRKWDRSKVRRPATPGRRTRIAVIGHSMGAIAASRVQGYDRRIATVAEPGRTGPATGASDRLRPLARGGCRLAAVRADVEHAPRVQARVLVVVRQRSPCDLLHIPHLGL